ncbi:MAG: SUF system NifU family Fe-S cluster assembly protein [Dehalococcoidia bacterium]|nr:SUF system NifU family Fe-S cluster assembly protein [Dehalococcoidia bacterium]
MTEPQTPAVAWEELDELYRHTILDHYKNPRNREALAHPDAQARGYNPFCGDEVKLAFAVRGGRVQQVSAQSQGCAICQASASLMSEMLKGTRTDKLRWFAERFRELMRGKGLSAEERHVFGDVEALAGVAQFPIRIKCALLAWSTLDEAMDDYEARHKT